MNNILITGSSGFIGSALCSSYLIDDLNIIGIDIKNPVSEDTKLTFAHCDLLDTHGLATLLEKISPTFIIHLAARTDLEEKQDLNGYAANTDGVKNLIYAIQRTSSVKRCIFTSSRFVCRPDYIPVSDRDYNPHTLYGQSKAIGEEIVHELDGGGIEWCIVRPTTVWGARMSLHYPHYQKLLKMIYSGQYFHVGNKLLYKSYSYIGNIVYQYKRILTAPLDLIYRKTLYLADYQPLSIRDWINDIQVQLGAKPLKTMPVRAAKALASIGDLIQIIGFDRFPFNSFRLENLLTEFIYDLDTTQKVCGSLPYTWQEGVQELVLWLEQEKVLKK